jgi:hypothetical protein
MQDLTKTRRMLGWEEASMALLRDCVEKSAQVLRIEDVNLDQRRESFEEWGREGRIKAKVSEGVAAGSVSIG